MKNITFIFSILIVSTGIVFSADLEIKPRVEYSISDYMTDKTNQINLSLDSTLKVSIFTLEADVLIPFILLKDNKTELLEDVANSISISLELKNISAGYLCNITFPDNIITIKNLCFIEYSLKL